MNIVLHEPQIPANTGNIARTCVATGASLHLIRPLGFHTDEKTLKRAGLDYWQYLNIYYYDDFDDFLQKNENPQVFMIETGGSKLYSNIKYPENPFVMFGKETSGIPKDILKKYEENILEIPMPGAVRSLNLSNAVAIVVYEILRQHRNYYTWISNIES